MKYAIDKDVITSMKDLKEGEISVVSTENYNTLLFGTQLSEITENKVEVGLKFIVRSTYSNEVLMIDDEIVQDLELLKSDVRGITGYFQVVHTLDTFIRKQAKVKSKLMAKTHLTTLGLYYNRELNKIYHVMNLVVLDDDRYDFLDMFNLENITWEKIVELISSRRVSKFDKMVLSQLRIVK